MLKWITSPQSGARLQQHVPGHPFGLGLTVADKSALLRSL